MPKVIFPYTKKGEENARAAAKMHGGRYVADSKKGPKGKPTGMSVMIAVGTPVKKAKKKSPVRRTKKKA